MDAPSELAEELVHPTSYELLNDTNHDWSREFAEYTRATQQFAELASLQAELMHSVATVDSLLHVPPAIPTQQPPNPPTEEVRGARLLKADEVATKGVVWRSSCLPAARYLLTMLQCLLCIRRAGVAGGGAAAREACTISGPQAQPHAPSCCSCRTHQDAAAGGSTGAAKAGAAFQRGCFHCTACRPSYGCTPRQGPWCHSNLCCSNTTA